MGRNIAIVVGAGVIAAAMLFIFRWEIGSYGGMAIRLDRWTGNMVASNAPSQMTVDGASLGLPVHLRCSDLTQNEIKQSRVDPTIR
jgi:hypothetical protein